MTPLPLSSGGQTISGATVCGSAAATVTRKLLCAEPPELLAVTTTCASTRKVSVSRLTRPLAASTVAPSPLTA